MRKFESEDSFYITGRGDVWNLIEPDPPFEMGEEIELNGKVGTIVGVERFLIADGPRPGWNCGVLLRQQIRLWHDDVRVPPDDSWTWVKTNLQAQQLLKMHDVTECSLDHDLGAIPTGETDPKEVMFLKGDSKDGCGLDLVEWMIEHDKVPPAVTIHSWNPPGAQRMAVALNEAGHLARVRPFEMPAGYEKIWRSCYE